jgi:hypothetical protein
MFDEPANRAPLIGAAVGLALALIVGGYYWHNRSKAPAPAALQPAPPAVAPAAPIEHPVPAAGASNAPLPDLNDSDKSISDALGEASGGMLTSFLVPDSIIRHVVVSIDNLPRQKVAVDKRPIVAAPGTFLVNGDELHATLDPRNYQRYAPMIDVMRKLDMKQIAGVYLRFYPLFQQAYQDLGYPNDYFNDRLVKVIDGLVVTPQITAPIDLVRPNVMYLFADPALESRPAGQKMLIRMGPDNAAVVKAKLAELRAIIATSPPKH